MGFSPINYLIMSWVRVWVHIVFSSKNQEHYLNSHIVRTQLFEHIMKKADEKGIWLDTINGYQEHAHCLISLG
jgi:putative transposase